MHCYGCALEFLRGMCAYLWGVCWGVEGMCTLGVLRDMCVLGC